METIYLPAINAEKKPITIIWLHGLGVDGSDFESFRHELKQFGGMDNINLVLPTAPTRKVTSIQKISMPAWYDLYTENFQVQQEEDLEGMNESRDIIQAIIDEERAKNPDTPLVLGGFSQGAAMSLLTGLSQQTPLLAIAAFSGYVPNHPRFDELSDVAQQIPIFMSHGALDSVIPINKAENGFHILNREHANVEFHQYPMMHELCPNEIADFCEFLQVHLDHWYAAQEAKKEQ